MPDEAGLALNAEQARTAAAIFERMFPADDVPEEVADLVEPAPLPHHHEGETPDQAAAEDQPEA